MSANNNKRKESPSLFATTYPVNGENDPNNKRKKCVEEDFIDKAINTDNNNIEQIEKCYREKDMTSLEKLKNILERNASSQQEAKDILSNLVSLWIDDTYSKRHQTTISKSMKNYFISTYRTEIKRSLWRCTGYQLEKDRWVPHPSYQVEAYQKYVADKQAASTAAAEAKEKARLSKIRPLPTDEIFYVSFTALPKIADRYFRDIFDKKSNDDQLDGFYLKPSPFLKSTPFAYKLSAFDILQAINGQSIVKLQYKEVREILQQRMDKKKRMNVSSHLPSYDDVGIKRWVQDKFRRYARHEDYTQKVHPKSNC